MQTVLALIDDYGTAVYAILFLYCALKSGALPLFGGYAAQQGVLDPVAVGAAALAGGYLGDELRFALARRYGMAWTAGRPRLARWMARARRLLERYGTAYLFLYRYPKGMRTVGALPVGMTDMRWRRFTALNAASALLWATLLVGDAAGGRRLRVRPDDRGGGGARVGAGVGRAARRRRRVDLARVATSLAPTLSAVRPSSRRSASRGERSAIARSASIRSSTLRNAPRFASRRLASAGCSRTMPSIDAQDSRTGRP